ncbi:MAG: hypothetical protein A2Y20_01195 [Firmicutes bacterium GWF2_51_9]|nr:MAG: hypothetical protein A2Y20_01195 [Firmicutes bacterium GWF2_51_9]OGS58350.1 MAG: hypothetical protein A2Y19_08550 [Firmicutes bacterium GWE2_51_13]HAM64172.1 hypothetical protein [Erysipelotrichaceae bacterium]HBZ40795.1 hypothetical protein [Erysipelotrichaceae bacterium]
MYYLLFFVPLLLHPLKIGNKAKGVLNSLTLGILSIFRFGSGADYFSYSYLYYLLPRDSILKAIASLSDQEVGLKLIMFPFRYLNLSYEVFIAFFAVGMMVLVYYWITRNSSSVSLSFMVYYSFFFVVWSISSLRQGLAITLGCFLLYNIRFHWNFKQRILIILLLFFVHKTSLFFLVLLLAEFIPWDRKKLTYLLLFSLVVSLLPVAEIALMLSKIPVFSRLVYYIDTTSVSIGFWDIKSLPRLFFIAVVLFHYDQLIAQGFIQKRFIHAYLIGLTFFFFLRFDDLIGARISIYGFFLGVLILPSLVRLYDLRKGINWLVRIALVLISALYLEKELVAMATQAGVPMKGYYVEYVTVFQQDTVTFDNRYYYSNNYNDFIDSAACRLEILRFDDDRVFETSTVKDPSKYIAAKFPNGKYGLIDVNGDVVLDGRYEKAEYYGGVIRVSSTEYFNYKGQALDTQKAAMIYFTAKAQTTKYINANLSWFEIGRGDLDGELVEALDEEGQFKFLFIVNQVKPLDFYVMEYLSYKYGRIYRLYTTEMNPMTEDYFFDAKTILTNRVVKARNICGYKFFNESGELIWMQLH